MLGISTIAENKHISEEKLNKLTPTYYVDAIYGNDSNPGTGSTSSLAWKTPNKVWTIGNNHLLKAGDVIAFRRGQVFECPNMHFNSGSLTGGTIDNPITFTSYGTGPKAIITSEADRETIWYDNGGDVWSATTNVNGGARVFKNNEELFMATGAAQLGSGNTEYYYSGANLYLYSTTDPNDDSFRWSLAFCFRIEDGLNVNFHDLDIQGGSFESIALWTSDNVNIINCNVGKNANAGISITNCSNIIIKGNNIDSNFRVDMTQITPDNSYYRGCEDGISCYTELNGCTVSNNYFKNWGHSSITMNSNNINSKLTNVSIHDNEMTAPDIGYGRGLGYSGYFEGNEIYNNYIHDTRTQNQLGGANNHFHHNIIQNQRKSTLMEDDRSGSGIWLQNYYIQLIDNVIENNIIVNTEGEGIYMVATNNEIDAFSGNTVRNNIVYNCGVLNSNVGLHFVEDAGEEIINNYFHNNLVYSSATTLTCRYQLGGTIYSASSFNDQNVDISNTIAGDPLFINPLSNWKLQDTSPCINSGTTASATTDYYGNVVPYLGTAVDIGIYETNEGVIFASNRSLTGGTGTLLDPYDIQTGFDNITNGTILYLRGGTYTLTGDAPSLYMGSLISNPATESSFRTVKNYPGETPILDASLLYWKNNESNGKSHWVDGVIGISSINQSYSVIDGIHIINVLSPTPTIVFEYNKVGIRNGGGAEFVTVKNCYTYNTTASGIYMSGDGHIIDNNEVELFTTAGNQEGITCYQSTGVTISNNYVHDVGNYNNHENGIGIDIKNGGSGSKVFGNRIHNTKLVAIYIDVRGIVDEISIYDNYIYNVGTVEQSINAIVLSNEQPALTDVINNAKIYNNICFNLTGKGVALGWSLTPGNPITNAQVVNNVFYNNSIGIACDATEGVGITAENIMIANNILMNNARQITLYHEYTDETQYTIDTNTIIGYQPETGFTNWFNNNANDPLFTDVANGDFTLQPTSPSIDSGKTDASIYEPTFDYDGNRRVVGGIIDIGAYESALIYGPELFINGKFEDGFTGGLAVNWTSSRGTPTENITTPYEGSSQNIANPTGNSGTLYQNINFTIGAFYKISWYGKSITGGGYFSSIGLDMPTVTIDVPTWTYYEYTVVADETSGNQIFYASIQATEGANNISVDNVSIKEVL